MCSSCNKNKESLASVCSEIAKEWHPTKNGSLTPKDVAASYSKKVWWLCPKGHPYEASPSSRKRGRGCPYCTNKKVLVGFNDLAFTHPDLAKEWHPTKNGSLTPQDVVSGSGKKVWWQCDKGHAYEAIVVIRRNTGCGCPYCSGQKVLEGFNDLASIHPELAREWHPIKNGKLKPTDVTTGNDRNVWWLCEKGHPYQAIIGNRVRLHSGCPYCTNKKVLLGFNDLESMYPEIAREWHPVKNGELTPKKVVFGSGISVWWQCKKGHSYEAAVVSRTSRGDGCPYCSGRYAIEGETDLLTVRPDIAALWHPTKNGRSPNQVSAGSGTEVWWLGECGHEWEGTVNEMTQKKSINLCPICNKESQTSFPEQAIFYYLKKVFPDAINRYSLGRKELDVFIPSINIGVEYDGVRFHTKDTKKKEDKKDAFFLKKGICVFRVKEYKKDETIAKGNIIYFNPKSNYKHLDGAIKKLWEVIKTNAKVEDDNIDIDIDTAKDNAEILASYLKTALYNI